MSLFPGAGPALPAPRRIDYAAVNAAFKKQKAALTRAKNSGDPTKVLETVEKTLDEWSAEPFHGAWPDDWATWRIALEDAARTLQRSSVFVDVDVEYRFNKAHMRFI